PSWRTERTDRTDLQGSTTLRWTPGEDSTRSNSIHSGVAGTTRNAARRRWHAQCKTRCAFLRNSSPDTRAENDHRSRRMYRETCRLRVVSLGACSVEAEMCDELCESLSARGA